MNAPVPRNQIPERAPPGEIVPSVNASAELDTASRLDPHFLLALLRRNFVVILVAIGLALAAGLLITLLTVPRYVAQTRIQIEQQVDRVLPTEDPQPAAATQDAERFLQTQTDVLKSRSVAIGVAQSLKLFGNSGFHAAMGVAPASSGNAAVERERVISLLRGNLGVDLPRNSRILTISFGSRDPQMASAIANAFAQVFITANLQRKFSSSAYARDFLAAQLIEAKARLERSERELNGYSRAAGLIAARPALGTTSQGGSTTPQSVTTASLQQLNDAYIAARAARVEAEQRWRSAAAAAPMTLPDVLASNAVQMLLQQRAGLTAELRLARERYRGDYPLLQEKSGQLEEVDRQLAQVAGDIRSSIKNKYQVAYNQERSLAGEVAGLKQATLAEQDRSVRFTILSREVETNRTLYDGLLQRFKELSAAAGVASNNISVVDTAEAPLLPASPRFGFNMALALLAGLMLAGGAVLAREQIDDVVRSPADLERKLHLAPLGVVPRVPDGIDPIAELSQPKTGFAESYNALRSALLYSTTDGLPRSILVTSTQAGEGKSTTSAAVAAGFAKLGRRVVLVDADLRRPSLHKMFGMAQGGGMSDLLIGQAELGDVAVSVADSLWLVGSGPLPPNPTDLLSGGRLPEVVRAMEAAFDLVIIDGPPVLGLADAPMLAANTRSSLFVLEANRGLRGRTKSAIRRLRLNNAHVLGALLTKFEARKAGVDQYYGYEYYAYGETKAG